MRPVAYAILAAAVCVAATLSTGKNDQAKAAARWPATGSP
jgi:hypothetical protein